MTRIQLLVADDRNRELLASFVAEWATPISHETVVDADLYLVDEASLATHREALRAHKHVQHPVFCPVILLSRDTAGLAGGLLDPGGADAPPLVDETLPVPVEKPVLARRLDNLLVRRQQGEALREKSERLEQFASKLSHELRNPLNLLDGYLSIARERGDAEAFEKCRTAIDRMERMITDTLLLAREGEVTLDRESVSLRSAVERSWEMVSSPRARLAVATDQLISADPDRLQALLVNLLRNAIEHGGEGVTITIGPLDDGFYVEDDGVGIPADDREAVFEEGHTTRMRGTGFGLSVVAEIVAAHGWEIHLTESSAGGSRFEITGVESA